MKKIPSLFKRDYVNTKLIYDEVVEGCEWVLLDNTCVATVKFDGTACAIINGTLYRRYDAKHNRIAPLGAIPCQEKDPVTGHQPHWVKVSLTNPDDKYFLIAFDPKLPDGTYELCGEKIQQNPEKVEGYKLIRHGSKIIENCPKTFNEIKEYLMDKDIEGIVWHNLNGKMAKIRKDDFGLKR